MTENEFLASRDIPAMKNIAVEHLERCEICSKRTASHAVGAEQVADDNQILQMFDHAQAALRMTSEALQNMNKAISSLQIMLDELQNSKAILPLAYKIGAALGAGIIGLAGVLAGRIF